jgi:ectoine hydroxylase-related dioxygenase (phytanoyl-CoA dioxygenase family)
MAMVGTAKADAGSPEVAERVRQFERDGYVVARGMFSANEMRDFIAECHSFEGKAKDRAEPNSKGSMQFYSELFRKSELIRRFVTQRTLIDFVAPIAGPDLWLRWDQAVAKGPQSGVFAWHTDTGYDLLPQPHFEVWIALSESRADNGGLYVVPGSHKQRQRHRRIDNHMVALDSERYDAADSGKLCVEASAGDVILFSSLLLHKTYENTTTNSRWAYVAEMLKLGDFDPTITPPYFVVARNGEPACEFVESLACARDPVQIVKTLPLALRHRVGKPLVKRIRAALKSSSASA